MPIATPALRSLGARPAGLRPAAVPLTIVTGAPAAGKNHWVERQRGAGDLVIDLDEIAAGLSGGPVTHAWPRRLWMDAALHERGRRLRALADPTAPWPAAWFIVCEPEPGWRDWWQRMLQPRRIVVVETSPATCLARIAADPDRRLIADALRRAVAHYATLFRPRPDDEIVSGEG